MTGVVWLLRVAEPTNTMIEIPTKKIPSEREIKEQESKLLQMREIRAEAKRMALEGLSELVSDLDSNDAMSLMKLLQSRLRGSHKKVRGSRVSHELKSSLEAAIKGGEYSLSQMEKIFNLSISYISRVKREMKERGEIPMNAYTDRQLNHQKKEEHAAA